MKGQLGSVTAGQEGQRSLSLRYSCFPESLSTDPYRNSVLFKRALGVQSPSGEPLLYAISATSLAGTSPLALAVWRRRP